MSASSVACQGCAEPGWASEMTPSMSRTRTGLELMPRHATAKPMELVVPSLERLPAYADALRRGFWSDNLRREESAREELAMIAANPADFVAALDDREGKRPPITLPDGSTVRRLPGFRRWMWDAGFCGSVNFRWQPGTSDLPKYVLGHLGY